MHLLLRAVLAVCGALFLSACDTPRIWTLADFYQPEPCFNRQAQPYTSVVDSHVHFKPFGGQAIPYPELLTYFEQTRVRFVNVYGIGQTLPLDSKCSYYLDCPGTPVTPGIKNDFANVAGYLAFKKNEQRVHLTFSMTFPDLANPDATLSTIALYEKEYPGVFSWMGEVNLAKQALLNNGHEVASFIDIDNWSPFMTYLREKDIPINIHGDIGSDDAPLKYFPLFNHVLETYPDNKIVWAHMGLSKELTQMPVIKHISLMKQMLTAYPYLMLDISWRVLADHYFNDPVARQAYVALMNAYPTRFLPGTDFVASADKHFSVYKEELEVNSFIFNELDDNAFRHIALGENYFRLLDLDYHAPAICHG